MFWPKNGEMTQNWQKFWSQGKLGIRNNKESAEIRNLPKKTQKTPAKNVFVFSSAKAHLKAFPRKIFGTFATKSIPGKSIPPPGVRFLKLMSSQCHKAQCQQCHQLPNVEADQTSARGTNHTCSRGRWKKSFAIRWQKQPAVSHGTPWETALTLWWSLSLSNLSDPPPGGMHMDLEKKRDTKQLQKLQQKRKNAKKKW